MVVSDYTSFLIDNKIKALVPAFLRPEVNRKFLLIRLRLAYAVQEFLVQADDDNPTLLVQLPVINDPV